MPTTTTPGARRETNGTTWLTALPMLAILLVLMLSPFMFDLYEWSKRLSSGG